VDSIPTGATPSGSPTTRIGFPRLRQWLFRFGHDDTLPIILTERRIFLLPTGSGLLFAVVLAVMLVGAINYTLSLGYALVFLLAGVGMAAMVHTFRNLRGLSITPGRTAPVHAGDTAHFPLHLLNPGRHARRALAFRFAGSDEVFADLAAGAEAVVTLPYPAHQRGWLTPGRITLATRYPLGLFRAWSYPYPRLTCLVYPRPISRPLPPPSAAAAGGRIRGDCGDEDFAGLRRRNPSDPTRHIAWKAVARSAEAYPLLVKQFAGSSDEELWLDWQMTAGEGDDETRLSVLTGWVLAADAAQVAYGLVLPGDRLPPALGAAHRDRCLQRLALYGQHAHEIA
jgi:uncharacterized protein (DUF58 family)